jgi:RIO kinase 1
LPIKDKVQKRLRKTEKRYEKEQLMKEKRSEEYEALEEVFDKTTLMTVYRLLNHGVIKRIHGVVESGKEARIYYGVDDQEREIAIKIYLTTSTEFKRGMQVYIQGDPRFKDVRSDTRSLIYTWAKKEYKNLIKAHNSGVKVPKPIYVEKNVLIMEFFGEKGVRAPLLKEKPPSRPAVIYKKVLSEIKKLYSNAGLVHGDLSEYNIINWREKPVIFDMSQAVLLEHPMAKEFLRRDIVNINRYFKSQGVKVKEVDEIYRWITENG